MERKRTSQGSIELRALEWPREWFASGNLWNKPLVRHTSTIPFEFDANAYYKGGWILSHSFAPIGEDAFFKFKPRGLSTISKANRGKNGRRTRRSLQGHREATHTHSTNSFSQWCNGAVRTEISNLSYTTTPKSTS